MIRGPEISDHARNVLIAGDGDHAEKVTRAIENNRLSGRAVRGTVAAHLLRGAQGLSTLTATARREFAEEIIIATNDPEAARTAVRVAMRNQIDIHLAPEMYGLGTARVQLEDLGGMPILKVCRQLPEWSLAAKRIADVMLASAGLLALLRYSPLFRSLSNWTPLDPSFIVLRESDAKASASPATSSGP